MSIAVDIEMYQFEEAFWLALPNSDSPIIDTEGAIVNGVLKNQEHIISTLFKK